MSRISKNGPEHTVFCLYDLRAPEVWARAHADRLAWGKALTVVHILDPDHVLIEFKPSSTEAAA